MKASFGVVWLMLVCLWPAVAFGHAVSLGNDPVNNAHLATAPERLEIRFNEAVTPVFVRLFDPVSGEEVSTDSSPRATGQALYLDLPEGLPEGGYVVSWRAISADSHPVGGSFRFSVGGQPFDWSGTADSAVTATDRAGLAVTYGLVRAVFLIGLLTYFGALAHLWWTARRLGYGETEWRWLSAVTALVIVTGGLQVALQGLRIYGPDFEWRFLSTALTLGGQSTLGQSTGVSLAAVILSWSLLFWRNNRVMLLIALIPATLSILGLLMTGHVATGPDRNLALPALAVHVLVAGFWLGSLPMLLLSAQHGSRESLIHTLQRFSRTAVVLVVLLLVAGLTLAVLQVESPDALLNTGYGRWLLLKVLMVVLILLVAVDNKWRLTQGLVQGLPDMRAKLRRNIRLEWLGMVVVLIATAALSVQPPPRADAHNHDDHNLPYGDMGEVVSARIAGTPWELDLQLAHDNIGQNQLILAFYDDKGAVRRPQEVQVRFSLPELDVDGNRTPVEPVGPIFLLVAEDVVMPGRWRIEVEALISDFEQSQYEFEVDLGR